MPMRAHIVCTATDQRPGEERGPQQRGAVLRARDGVGRDAGGIVVGGAGDDAGSEALPERAQSDGTRYFACAGPPLRFACIDLWGLAHFSVVGRAGGGIRQTDAPRHNEDGSPRKVTR